MQNPAKEVSPEFDTPRSRAIVVAAGILASRLFGLLRMSLAARYFGAAPHMDVFKAAFSVPNLLQNLLGEGTLSAAFIPTYSRMLKEGRAEDAGRFAGCILGILVVVISVCVLLGMTFAYPICWTLMPGFASDSARLAAGEIEIDRLALATDMVQLAFPMAGLLVLSAWALGVLNSHRRFLVPYLAPVVWNVGIITALLLVGTASGISPFETEAAFEEGVSMDALTRLLRAAFLGGLVGGALQLMFQLPFVAQVIKGFRVGWSTRVRGVRAALRAAGPAIAGRGVAQLSAWLDLFLASMLAAGSVAALGFAQVLYLLPISLFGLSVAASGLPDLSRLGEENLKQSAHRIQQDLRQGLLLVVPTALGYLALGYILIGGIYRGGNFGADDTMLIYGVLAAYSLGLVATVSSRLVHNGFWALGDTRTPARMSAVRLMLSVVVAVPVMLGLNTVSLSQLPQFADSELTFGAVGLGLGSATAAWVEFRFLAKALMKRYRDRVMPWRTIGVMVLMAAVAVLPAWGVWQLVAGWPLIFQALAVVGVYAGVYLLMARRYCRPECNAWAGRLIQRTSRRAALK